MVFFSFWIRTLYMFKGFLNKYSDTIKSKASLMSSNFIFLFIKFIYMKKCLKVWSFLDLDRVTSLHFYCIIKIAISISSFPHAGWESRPMACIHRSVFFLFWIGKMLKGHIHETCDFRASSTVCQVNQSCKLLVSFLTSALKKWKKTIKLFVIAQGSVAPMDPPLANGVCDL